MNKRAPLLIAGLVLLLALLGGAWWLLGDDPAPATDVPDVVAPAVDDAASGVLPPAVTPAAAGSDRPRTAPVPLDSSAPITVVEGRLIDSARRPVPDATLLAFLSSGALPLQPRESVGAPVTSGADGRFRLTGVPEGVALGLEITHAEHAPLNKQPFTATLGEPRDLGDITLVAGLLLKGRVTDEGGRPLEGATVSLTDLTALPLPGVQEPAERVAVTDADGHYRLPHLAMRRQFALTARLDGFASLRTVISFVLDIPGDSWEQNFMLQSADQLLGGIVLDDQGRPVDGVELTISRRKRGGNTYFQDARLTGPDGRFLFEGVPDDSFDLRVVAPFAYLSSKPKLEAGRTDHEVWVLPALRMHGRLVGTHEPPTDFEVKALPDARTGALLVPGAEAVRRFRDTQPPGTFAFDGLKPGTWFFEVEAEGFAVSKSSSLILGENTPDPELLIHLYRGGDIVGRLAEPRAGVPVELRPGGYDPALSIEGIFPTRPVHGLATVTAADGSFRLAHVPEEVYTVSLKPPGAPALHVSDVEVREGGTTDLGALTLPASCVVSGRVTWLVDELQPPFKITASGARSFQNTLTDEDGAFELGALEPGDYKITATPQGFFEAIRFRGDVEVTLQAGDEREVVIDLGHAAPPAPRAGRGN